MKTPQAGIIARFLEVSSVRTPTRRELSEGTQDQYSNELRKFWRWSGKKPASQWTGASPMDAAVVRPAKLALPAFA